MSKLSDFMGGGGSIMRRQLFTAAGTWTKPADLIGDQVWVTMIGGGGSGAASATGGPTGGNGGVYATRVVFDVSGTSLVSVTVGSGGASSVPDNPGIAGSASSFGGFISVPGGSGGGLSSYGTVGSVWGNDVIGYAVASTGLFGAPPARDTGSISSSGGPGLLIGTPGITGGDSGDSFTIAYGGNGYGAGGGAYRGSDSGAGAPGAVLVEWLEKV